MPDAKGKYIEVNGITMYYEVYGSGTPLVLIHGGTGTGQMHWAATHSSFADHFQVIVPDSRGHGRTNNPSREISYAILGDDYAALIEALQLEKPGICGWSDGGQIAIELGMKKIDLGAIIIGGAYSSFEQLNTETFQAWGIEAPGLVNFDTAQKGNLEIVEMLQEHHMNWQELMLDLSYLWLTPFEYLQEDFSKISSPAMVMIGDRDEFIRVEEAVKMYRMLPAGELAVIPGGTHRLPLTNPGVFSSVAREFLLRHKAQ